MVPNDNKWQRDFFIGFYSRIIFFPQLLALVSFSSCWQFRQPLKKSSCEELMRLECTYFCRPFSRGMGTVSCRWLSTEVDCPLEANMAHSNTYETEKYHGWWKNNNNSTVHLHLVVLPLDFHCGSSSGISNLVPSIHVAVQESPQIVSMINITRCHRFFCWSPIWWVNVHKADALLCERVIFSSPVNFFRLFIQFCCKNSTDALIHLATLTLLWTLTPVFPLTTPLLPGEIASEAQGTDWLHHIPQHWRA